MQGATSLRWPPARYAAAQPAGVPRPAHPAHHGALPALPGAAASGVLPLPCPAGPEGLRPFRRVPRCGAAALHDLPATLRPRLAPWPAGAPVTDTSADGVTDFGHSGEGQRCSVSEEIVANNARAVHIWLSRLAEPPYRLGRVLATLVIPTLWSLA